MSLNPVPFQRRWALTAACLALVAWPSAARSQAVGPDRASFMIAPVSADAVISRPATPAASINVPGAWGADWGLLFAGGGYQGRTRYTEDDDGAVVVGLGIGNAYETIGLEVAYTSVSTVRSGLFDRSTLSFKAHRALTPSTSLAVGFENAVEFGETGDPIFDQDGGQSLYAVLGKVYLFGPASQPFSQVTIHLGAGNGRFRSEENVLADTGSIGVFGGAAVRVIEQASVIAEWTGQDAALGLSLAPFRTLPVTITSALVDLTGSAGDGTRFSIGIGFGARFTN